MDVCVCFQHKCLGYNRNRPGWGGRAVVAGQKRQAGSRGVIAVVVVVVVALAVASHRVITPLFRRLAISKAASSAEVLLMVFLGGPERLCGEDFGGDGVAILFLFFLRGRAMQKEMRVARCVSTGPSEERRAEKSREEQSRPTSIDSLMTLSCSSL